MEVQVHECPENCVHDKKYDISLYQHNMFHVRVEPSEHALLDDHQNDTCICDQQIFVEDSQVWYFWQYLRDNIYTTRHVLGCQDMAVRSSTSTLYR